MSIVDSALYFNAHADLVSNFLAAMLTHIHAVTGKYLAVGKPVKVLIIIIIIIM